MDMAILSMVIDMRKNDRMTVKLYFAFSVLLLTAVCIVVYTSWRNGNPAENHTYDSTSGQEGMTDDMHANAWEVSHTEKPDDSTTNKDVQTKHPSDDLTNVSDDMYYLVVKNGYLQVFETQTGTLFMETAIVYELLPDRVKAQVDQGKYFQTEHELLEFLENYSS